MEKSPLVDLKGSIIREFVKRNVKSVTQFQDFAIKRIVHHNYDAPGIVYYNVRWYGYLTEE